MARPSPWSGPRGLPGPIRLPGRLAVLVVGRVAHTADAAVCRLLAEVAARIDVDAVVRRVDLDALLDRLDLTEIVLDRVDLEVVLDAALARLDLVGLAEQVIDGVDLPAIIRESTGSMASDTVTGLRLQGVEADRAVARVMDRLLLRADRALDEPRPRP